MSRVRARFLTVLVGLGLIVVGCGTGASQSTPAPAGGSTAAPAVAPAAAPAAAPQRAKMTIALAGQPDTLDPQWRDDGAMRAVTENTHEGLVTRNAATNLPEPLLATSWKQLSTTETEFKLRTGVKFANGNPFNADDVVYSVQRLLDKAYGSQAVAAFFTSFAGARKVDDSTVVVVTNAADPVLLNRLALFKIMDKESTEGKTKEFMAANPMGTGPFKFVKWDRDVSIVIEGRSDYWGGPPPVKTVEYRFIGEDATRLAGLQSGSIDLSVSLRSEYVSKVPQVIYGPSPAYYYIHINRYKGLFTDPKLAMAVQYAVDRQALTKIFEGHAKPKGLQPYGESTFGYQTDDPGYPYDLAKAKALMKEAGYSNQPIDFLSSAGQYSQDKEVAEAVTAMLQQVGFNIKLRALAWSAYVKVSGRKTETPPLLQLGLHTNDIGDPDRTLSAKVWSKSLQSIYSTSADAKIEQARTEPDLQKRAGIYQSIIKDFYNDPPWIPLFNIDNLYGASKDLVWTPRVDEQIIVKDMRFK